MLQTIITWNIFSMIYVIVAIGNITLLLFIAHRVYTQDKESIINRLFTLAVLFMIQTFVWFPIGGIFWDFFVFGLQFILITTRIFQLSSFTSVLIMYWCSRVLRDGEFTWRYKRNIRIIVISLVIYLIAMLTPDAVYIIKGPPEIDTGEGLIFSLVFYPGTMILLLGSILHFWQAYRDYNNEDPVLGQQALRLTIGLTFGVLGIIVSFLSTAFVAHFLTPLMLSFMTCGVMVMSMGFTKEAGLLKLKITNELRRLMVLLNKGWTMKAYSQMEYITDLVEKEGSMIYKIRLLTLEGIIAILHSDSNKAKEKLTIAKSLAEEQKFEFALAEIQRHLQHIAIQETASSICENIEGIEDCSEKEGNLDLALGYLESIIQYREEDI